MKSRPSRRDFLGMMIAPAALVLLATDSSRAYASLSQSEDFSARSKEVKHEWETLRTDFARSMAEQFEKMYKDAGRKIDESVQKMIHESVTAICNAIELCVYNRQKEFTPIQYVGREEFVVSVMQILQFSNETQKKTRAIVVSELTHLQRQARARLSEANN